MAMESGALLASFVPTMLHAARDTVQLPMWVEMFTIIVASASGAITARAYRLDLVGAITIGIVTGLSGGLLRDMILQVGDVYILNQWFALPLSALTGLVVFLVPLNGPRVTMVMQAIDILNVGLYCAMGTDKAFAYDFSIPACLLMGAITGVGGGLIRDICLAERPALFSVGGNLYAITAIFGSAAYLAARMLIPTGPTGGTLACVAVTIVLRWVSVRFDIKSPGPMDLPSAVARSARELRQNGRFGKGGR